MSISGQPIPISWASKGIRSVSLSPSTMDPSDHSPPKAAAKIIAYLCGPGGDAHLGGDFRLKSDEGMRVAGLV